MARVRVTSKDIRPHLPDLLSMELVDLAHLIRDEVQSARATAALIILLDRASRPEILNYREYLRSDAWKKIRQRKLTEAGNCCSLCTSRKNLQVHHRTYERLGKERLDDLVVLCRHCHSRHHSVLA